MQKRLLCVGFFFIVSCSSTPKHIGEHWSDNGPYSCGIVRSSDGNLSDEFVAQFKENIKRKDFDLAYAMLDTRIAKKISKQEFIRALKGVDAKFGAEKSFIQQDVAIPKLLGEVKLDEALSKDAFKFYTAVGSQYVSKRQSDLTYSFGLAKSENSETVKLLSLGIFREGKPIFVLHPFDPVLE
ncbi:hypothetical protein [Bdellovibrio sp. HCB-110]|uniref:hypothetical protein n=1 Tax=Bdellovibrio sp. HCB-110 TaxID=3391182 RepID=UPI0039B4DFC8